VLQERANSSLRLKGLEQEWEWGGGVGAWRGKYEEQSLINYPVIKKSRERMGGGGVGALSEN